MWQLYAQTALDLVRERQVAAEREARLRGIVTRGAWHWRRAAARGAAAFGRMTGALADASCALAARLERPAGSA